jgi:membrane fusion protein (multidrug efflux system)
MRCRSAPAALAALFLLAAAATAHAQFGPGGPPAVGVAPAQQRPIVESNEFVGRVQAVEKVDLVPRVTAFLQEIHFKEGAEVQKGDLLYVLEQGPFQADVAAKQAAVAESQALLRNATLTLGRAQALLNTPAGQRSVVDDALAQQASRAAQLQSAQAQLRQAEINLAYTEIRAPITGKITRTNVTVGNVVTPSSGPLATIYSQDPMYVIFPVAAHEVLDLRTRYAAQGGLDAVKVHLRLADGRLYGQTGTLDYIEPTIARGTDTVTLRARIVNPLRPGAKPGGEGERELLDGEFVTVILESPQPRMALTIPRRAVLTDQQGHYVYVVGPDKKAEQRRIELGQSTPDQAVVIAGLKESEEVIVDGLQRVRPGAPVNPAPESAGPQTTGASGGGKAAG